MRLAKAISYITHPVFATIAMLVFVLFQKDSYVYYTISEQGRWFFILVATVLTVVAPMVSVGYLVYSNQISSLHIENRNERIIPLVITAAYGFGLYYLFSQFQIPSIILAIAGVGVIGVITTLLITMFWKISAHMVAISGFGGMVLALSHQVHPVETWVIMVIFILMGIIGWARLRLEAHTFWQVIVAWIIGFIIAYQATIYLL